MIIAARCRFCALDRRWVELASGALVSTTEAGRNCQAPDNFGKPCRPRTPDEVRDQDELRRQNSRLRFTGK